jgi:hypothetical protein
MAQRGMQLLPHRPQRRLGGSYALVYVGGVVD